MRSLVLLISLFASIVYSQSAIYEQCGGSLWTGSTSCASSTTCQYQNPYYSQCLPGGDGSSGATSSEQNGDSTGNGSSDGGSNSDGLEMNVGAAISSMPAAATSSILAAELTISAPAAATSSQSASQTEDGGSPTTGGSSSNNYVNNNSGDGTSNGGSSGGASSGSEDTGGSNPGPASSVGSSSSGNSSAPQPVIGGHCGAYTGDKTGVASTTHYYDGQKGACGCGSGSAMAQWQSGAADSKVFTAAGSSNLFGGSSTWCGSGCGQCYELTNLGALPATNMGECTGAGQTITVMITNLCPVNGNEQWCSVPDSYGFPAHFDIMSQGGPNGWNNPVVSYKQVTCPGSMTSDYASCECATGKTSRARRGLFGATNFGY